MTPIINAQLPEFKVQAYHNGNFTTVTSDDVKGKWAIFFFYPADFTFVCPTELVDLAEKYDKLKSLGVEVYSVSTDSHFVHKAWHDASESIRKITPPIKPFNRISCFIQKKGYIFVARKKEKLVITFKTRNDYDTYY